MNKADVISIAVSVGGYKEFLTNITAAAKMKTSQYVCIANVHMLVEGHNDRSFAEIVSNADYITPDGMPLTWAMRLLYGIRQDRVTGMDLLPDLLSQASRLKLPVYFYGGTEKMLTATGEYLKVRYPDVQVAGMYSPPFRELTEDEEEEVVRKINASGAAFLFVVLGCPKQEKWIAAMKGRIDTMMVAVGGAVPVMIGWHKRAPKWMQKRGLEWVYRLILEPRRLFKRYAVTNTKFFFLLLKAVLQKNFNKPTSTT